MDATVVAASAAAAAAKEAALAASAAAATAAKDVAVAAVTANEAAAAAKEAALAASAAALNAKEAAVAASAAALNAKEAAATASAVALHAKEAADVATSAGEAAAAAAATVALAIQASKKRKFHLINDDQDPPGSASVNDVESVDFISRLPDAVLGSIVSLLPTKEGARTQAISRRWRPLWRSAPLNLVARGYAFRSKGLSTVDLITKILSKHPGPARHFTYSGGYSRDSYDKMGGWLSSQALDNLHELELTYNHSHYDKVKQVYLLPSSAYRFADTLRVAKFSGCHFPDLIVQLSLKFPCLKQLTLERVTISKDALNSIFSGCLSLESLELKDNFGISHLYISSQTLKSLGFSADRWRGKEGVILHELVIENAPNLERLLPLDPTPGPATIWIISAPKLKILGMLSGDIAELHFGTTVFQKMVAVSLTTKIYTIRVLVLGSDGLSLDKVVNFLKCFPCLAKLHFIFRPESSMDTVQKHDPRDPIECLELHLKEVVLKNYDGTIRSCIDFTKFFVLTAKVLKEMKITLAYHRLHKWFANQRRLLQIEKRASQDARIELTCGWKYNFSYNRYTHDLSLTDPYDMPSSECDDCKRRGLL